MGSSLGQTQAGGTGAADFLTFPSALDDIVSAAASAGYDGDLKIPYYAYE